MKLDFIDAIKVQGRDPAIAEDFKGRDIKSVTEATERLISDIYTRLSAIKPDVLVEFRQRYIGPSIRAAANMVCAPLDVFPAEDLSGFAEAWASGIPARPRRGSWHNDHLTSPASACRARRRCYRRSDSSLPGREPLPAQPRRPPFRCSFLCPV